MALLTARRLKLTYYSTTILSEALINTLVGLAVHNPKWDFALRRAVAQVNAREAQWIDFFQGTKCIDEFSPTQVT